MIVRTLWIIALVVIASMTAAFQLDRQARVSSELAELVPEQFRAFAQAHRTASALAGSDADRALVEAQKLVERRPLPAENLRLLAVAQFRAGFQNESAKTIQIAARRGWRDLISQEAMMRFALASDDKAEATRRFIALMLKPQTSNQTLAKMGELIFREPTTQAHQTLVELLVATEKWHSVFVRRSLQALPSDAYVAVLVEANLRGVEFDCYQLQLSLRAIERRPASQGPSKAIQDLIARQCR